VSFCRRDLRSNVLVSSAYMGAWRGLGKFLVGSAWRVAWSLPPVPTRKRKWAFIIGERTCCSPAVRRNAALLRVA